MAADNSNGANIEELTGKTEQFIEDNSRNLIIAIAAVAVIIVSVVGYGKFIVEPATAANEDTWRAEQYFMMDSVDLALNGDGLYPGLYDIATTTTAPRPQPAPGGWSILRSGRLPAPLGLRDAGFKTTSCPRLPPSTLATVKLNSATTKPHGAPSRRHQPGLPLDWEDFLAPIALYKGALVTSSSTTPTRPAPS